MKPLILHRIILERLSIGGENLKVVELVFPPLYGHTTFFCLVPSVSFTQFVWLMGIPSLVGRSMFHEKGPSSAMIEPRALFPRPRKVCLISHLGSSE